LRLDEEMQPIPWTERPTGAPVGAGLLWPGGKSCLSGGSRRPAGRPAALHYRHHSVPIPPRSPLSPSTLGISISTTRLFSAYKRQSPYFFK